ncbi:hypothetical protein LPJ53_003893 [Coemansia erecta]|uniref:B box-type domain-containing protein n=1 Tax=Coemansia erecta TaxID=147472 RepID=A0A9W8CPR7_9FUNG|nr:hypothetical protein LPJ53_003893 [Coemansia erecta]
MAAGFIKTLSKLCTGGRVSTTATTPAAPAGDENSGSAQNGQQCTCGNHNTSESEMLARNSIHVMQQTHTQTHTHTQMRIQQRMAERKPHQGFHLLRRRGRRQRRGSRSGTEAQDDFVMVSRDGCTGTYPYSSTLVRSRSLMANGSRAAMAASGDLQGRHAADHTSGKKEETKPGDDDDDEEEYDDNVPIAKIYLAQQYRFRHMYRNSAGTVAGSAQSSGTYTEDDVAGSIAALEVGSPPWASKKTRRQYKKAQQQQQTQQQRRRRGSSSASHSSNSSSTATAQSTVHGSTCSPSSTTHTLTEQRQQHQNQKIQMEQQALVWTADKCGFADKADLPLCTTPPMAEVAAIVEARDTEPLTVAVLAAIGEEESCGGDNDNANGNASDSDGAWGQATLSRTPSQHSVSLSVRQQLQQQQPAAAAAVFGDDGESTHHAERCVTHPGQRNDMWCDECQAAICSHCARAAHGGHATLKLSEAYNDVYEEIEEVQMQLVQLLGETRRRQALVDAGQRALAAAYAQAQAQLADDRARDEARLHALHTQALEHLVQHEAACSGWRQHLDAAAEVAQTVAEDFSQAQAVAERGLAERLLAIAENSRPETWGDPVEDTSGELGEVVRPGAQHATLVVPRVADLGRKRGHVRVSGDAFAALGGVWRMEARRTNSRTGEPMLAVTVSCVERGEGPGDYTVGVQLADAPTVRAREHCGAWVGGASHEFVVCAMDALGDSDALAVDGSVAVCISVRAESYRSLAEVQASRIAALEQRVAALETERAGTLPPAASSGESSDGVRDKARLTASLRAERRRRPRSESRGWATSPRRSEMVPASGDANPVLAGRKSQQFDQTTPTLAVERLPSLDQVTPLLISERVQGLGQTTPLAAGNSASPLALDTLSPRKPEHRRAVSLTTKLRRAPPIPFPLDLRAHSMQLNPMASESQTSLASNVSGTGSVFKRLGGWVRGGLGRAPHAGGSPQAPAADDLDEWTFLDKSLSPGFPGALASTQSLSALDVGSPGAAVAARRRAPLPPTVPLPPLPQALRRSESDAVAAAAADDPPTSAVRRNTDAHATESALVAQRASVMQRLQALELIRNTAENSRDGYSHATLRRISSEVGLVVEGRQRRLDAARRAGEKTDGGSDTALPERRQQTRARRDSSSDTRPKAAQSGAPATAGAQLTPQAARRGGILKPGRSRRETGQPQLQQQPASAQAHHHARTHGRVSASSAAAAARKRVRFPEENRLLETIRMVDPHLMQAFEQRAAATAARQPSPDDANGERRSGLAARVRSSPRMAPRSVPLPGDESDDDTVDDDDDDDDDDNGNAGHVALPPPAYVRPPRPQLRWGDVGALHVGPNTQSAQSSPAVSLALGSSVSSPSPADADDAVDARRRVFGAEHIPEIARGRNTAFSPGSLA